MPVGPLIFFVVFAVLVALVFAFAFMPPNQFVEKVFSKKREKPDGKNSA